MNTHICESKRREIVQVIEYWRAKTELSAKTLSQYCSLPYKKFLRWRQRLDEVPASRKIVPKSHWLLPEEIRAIVSYSQEHPGHGYRRLAWMLTDDNVAYASPSTVYRILRKHDLLITQERKPSRKGKGFEQPTKAHEHWHVDFSYFKIGGVFYYFIAILDGFSRTVLAWDLRAKMAERDAEQVIQAAKEMYCCASDEMGVSPVEFRGMVGALVNQPKIEENKQEIHEKAFQNCREDQDPQAAPR